MRNEMTKMLAVPGLAGWLLAGVAMPLAMTASARAEVVTSPTQALKLLTEARVAAGKCGWLSAAERGELADYAAKAELVTVRRAGAAAAKRAVAAGRKLGRAGCSAEKHEKTLAVLLGAREAMRGQPRRARRQAQRRVATARQPVQRQQVQRQQVKVQQAMWRGKAMASVRQGGGSGSSGEVRRYQRLAAAYYGALKCRNLPQAELVRMWREVRDLHYAILRRGKKQALARAKQAAQRAGTASRCG